MNDEHWAKIFKSIRKLCNETKLKEFQFKFIHRIVVTELFKCSIKTDDECFFCGEKDLIIHTKVILQFNTTYNSQISPTAEELLFGITSNLPEKNTNYVTLFMHYYVYSKKLNNKPIVLHDFVNALHQRNLIENTVNN